MNDCTAGTATRFDVSIIIPVYQVEEFLEECLDSVIEAVRNINAEVIMVDDGSTDGSPAIAKRYAQEHENFIYHYKENGGLGSARNAGIRIARGKYITFLDSDDIVAPDMYYNMFMAAEKNDCDISICDVVRLRKKGFTPSSLHQKLFFPSDENILTNIKENPHLIYNSTSCNTMIRREYWLERECSFPEAMRFEDIPIITPLVCTTDRIALVRKVGYQWRIREGNTKSITQENKNIINLQDRLKAVLIAKTKLQEFNCDDEIMQLFYKKSLEIDLMIFVNMCAKLSKRQAKRYVKLLKDFIDNEFEYAHFSMLPVIMQQKYDCIMRGDLDHLNDIISYEKGCYYKERIIMGENGEPRIDIQADNFTIDNANAVNDLKYQLPSVYIDRIDYIASGIEIFAHCYTNRINADRQGEQSYTAKLVNLLTGASLQLPLEYVAYDSSTSASSSVYSRDYQNVTEYNYNHAGFKLTVSSEVIFGNESFLGNNYIVIDYSNRFVSGSAQLRHSARWLRKLWGRETIFFEKGTLRLSFDEAETLFISEVKDSAGIVNPYYRNGTLEFELLGDETEGRDIAVVKTDGSKCLKVSRSGAQCMVDCDELENGSYAIAFLDDCSGEAIFDPACLNDDIADEFDGEGDDSFVDNNVNDIEGSSRDTVRFKRGAAVLAEEDGKCIVIHSAGSDNNAAIEVYDRITRAAVTAHGAQLNISTVLRNPSADYKEAMLFLHNEHTGGKTVLAVADCTSENGNKICSFTVDFCSHELCEQLYQAERLLFIEYVSEDSKTIDKLFAEDVSFETSIEKELLQIGVHPDKQGWLRLVANQEWADYENNTSKRNYIKRALYREFREEPVNEKVILFESMWGGKYSCNPQYLYEYIDRNYPEYKCVWALSDVRVPVPGNAVKVRRLSRDYYYYLATAKYLVNNVNFVNGYVKRPEQIEIQTMHGTPYKSIGLDSREDFPSQRSRNAYLKKCNRWNYLIVQGEFVEKIAGRIYGFNKTVLKTGYPRTDRLMDASVAERAEAIKAGLDLPKDKKIIVYAPTWRTMGRFDMMLDMDMLKEALSDEYVFIYKLHHLSAASYDIPEDREFSFDFTKYDSIEDLYTIADILITDYSSVMFDYASTHKPMIFFTYDLEEYSNSARGVYFDITEEAPGPLTFNTEEVIAAIKDSSGFEKYEDRIKAFYNKYLTYECANSCEKIFDLVFKRAYATPAVRRRQLLKKATPKGLIKLFKKVRGY